MSDANGRGIFRAKLTLTDSNGNVRYAQTTPFGYYRFSDITAGETYVIGVTHRQYRFQSQAISVDDNLTEVDFVGGKDGYKQMP